MNEINRVSTIYLEGAASFIEFAKANTNKLFTCPCSCKKCRNRKRLSFKNIEQHLFTNDIFPSYDLWGLHRVKPSNNMK